MNKKNLIGILAAGLVFAGSFWISGGLAMYWNFAALAIVLSGVAASLLLSYPYEEIASAVKTAKVCYADEEISRDEVVSSLIGLSVKSRMDGMLSLEKAGKETELPFLKNALMLLVDNFDEKEIKDCLKTEMSFLYMRRMGCERIFNTMARFAPAFGVAGSVIGLIGLLMGIENPQVILKHIPIAFISTLYGVILSNMIFAPIAENIRHRTRNELINQKMILEGILAIKQEQNPFKLERKLIAFLSPEDREQKSEELRKLTRRYIKMKKKEKAEKDTILHEVPLVKAS
ncbi:motility protein A [Maridesulfovibrio bastinii]|uniref:motility protein A n=1 Tax=Maridesulfovibrio bastinii TaxID=47157 RepID=UPI0003FC6865|nr:MotA/TolQ/ExbB proton channel family protein [Maridesulfovibrio bastinii]